MKLRDRARRLFGRERELSEHSVNASRVDHAVLRDLRRRATKVDEAVTTPPRLPSGAALDGKVWERLAEDVWSEFYGSAEPEVYPRTKVDQRFHVNRELADKNARDEHFRRTRSMTRGQVAESGIGLLGALSTLGRSYGNELAEHASRENEIADAEDHIDSIDDMLAELRQQRQSSDGEQTADIDAQIRDLAERKRAAVSELKEAVAQQAKHGGDLIDAVRVAVAKANEDAQEAIECATLLPGKGAGNASSVPVDVMMQFADRVHASRLLRSVLDMLGRLDLSMGGVRRQLRKSGFEEMVDIEMGNELSLVLPHEKALLLNPIARLDFYRRFHERSLMQYEMWSEQEEKHGPIIIGADGSSSMNGAPNVFCRGLTLATCGIGNAEGRNTAAIEFGSSGQLREFWFPGDKPLDTAVALDFAEHFFKGGTDINQVLLRAYDLIRNEEPFYSADLLIITDGGDQLTDSTYVLRDKLREMGVKIHGICVGIQPTPYMIEVCENVSSVFDFAGPNSTSDRIAIDLS